MSRPYPGIGRGLSGSGGEKQGVGDGLGRTPREATSFPKKLHYFGNMQMLKYPAEGDCCVANGRKSADGFWKV